MPGAVDQHRDPNHNPNGAQNAADQAADSPGVRHAALRRIGQPLINGGNRLAALHISHRAKNNSKADKA